MNLSKKIDIFDTLYANLNAEQRLAVDTIDGPVMVIAGPGTGKTTLLTLRIANILRRTDTPANAILAITYTDAGVKAMRTKLQEVIGDRAHEVRIFTFHGFASFLIAEYPDHFLHMFDMKIMTDIEQESLIRSILNDPALPVLRDLRPSGKPDAYLSSIIRSIDDAKREALTPEAVRKHAREEIDRIKNDESSISTRGATKGQLKADAKEMIEKCEKTFLFADVYEQYEARKRTAEKIDFNDLIIEILLALKSDELLLRLIQERFLYIHVDEHQDTNDAQNFIVALVAEFFETPNIFIVGDEKQAIYRFQGASVENFLMLQKHWPKMKVISLSTNYRSHQHILDASFGMIEKNYEEGEHKHLRIQLKSGVKLGKNEGLESESTARPIDVVTGANTAAIELHLIDELKKIVEQKSSTKKPTVAIIVRRNRDLDRVIRLLESHNIPVSSERSVDIFSHPVGRLFFDLIEYLIDPTRVDVLAKTVIAGMWGFHFTDAVALVNDIRRGNGGGGGNAAGNDGDFTKRLPGLVRIHKEMLSDSAVGFLIHAARASGYTSLVAQDPTYVFVWRGIVALAESLTREGNIHDPRELMEHMLAYRTSAESRTVKVAVGAPDVQIRALTAHGSKGLEFDYVFIPYATEDAWVGRNRGASFVLPRKQVSEGDIRDVRRLFYVALTRGRRHVTVLTALEESDGKVLTPLRCIDELEEKSVSRKVLPRVAIDAVYPDASPRAGQLNQKHDPKHAPIVQVAQHVLLEKGLSVTALNHFIACPNEFIFQSILKLPQAPSIPSEKGNAMHDAIAHVWISKDRMEGITVELIESILIDRIKAFFTNSLLGSADKATAERELLEDAPAVARALVSHFATADHVLTESWVKTEFKGTYTDDETKQTQNVTIPIHGKLDVLVDADRELSIYDYKTKQAMSIAAIKGETKSSDGNYFRQLIFYKLLVKDDTRWKGKHVNPALVFVSPDDKGRCPIVSIPIEDTDMKRVEDEIQSLIDSVWSGKITHARCDDRACEYCGLAGLLKN